MSFLILSMLVLVFYFFTIRSFSITNVSILIFYIFFFLISPVMQILKRGTFTILSTVPYNDIDIFKGNMTIFLFLLVYLLWRLFLDKGSNLPKYLPSDRISVSLSEQNSFKLLFVSVLIFVILFNYNFSSINSMLMDQLGKEKSSGNQIYSLIFRKTIMVMPMVFLIFAFVTEKLSFRYLHIILALIIVLFFKNPLVEHRNGFGLVYLVAFWAVFSHVFYSGERLLGLFFASFGVLFPLSQAAAPHRFIADEFNVRDLFISTYNTVNFDAWSNVIAGFSYVDDIGHTYGEQLLSSLLFWVPRAFWESKSVATGQLVGEYLIDHHNHWMTNISWPIMAEAYLDFSFFGVIFYAIVFAFLANRIDKAVIYGSSSVSLCAVYASFSFIFLLRGPLLSSLAYTLGGLIGIFIMLKLSKRKKI
ncbi:oligosaccharide repeat unit polymerase [Amylibacter sp.]|nr:oligosaccharide repeat unit polymerase [Amylibacter sp.]